MPPSRGKHIFLTTSSIKMEHTCPLLKAQFGCIEFQLLKVAVGDNGEVFHFQQGLQLSSTIRESPSHRQKEVLHCVQPRSS